MSEETLPTVIILSILKLTHTGKDLAACRRVCRRWKGAVDSMGDQVWKHMCRKEFSDTYEGAYIRANLSWRDLYKSLSLWPRIQSAKLKWRELQTQADENGDELLFQIIKHEMGVVKYRVGYTRDMMRATNLIVYYNLETLEESRRENFDFLFCRYLENEHFIAVVRTSDGNLCVIPKANRKRFFIGEVSDHYLTNEIELIGNEVYFKTKYYVLCVARLEENDGDITVNTTVLLDSFPGDIVAIQYVEKDKLLILGNEGNMYSISHQQECEVIDKIDDLNWVPQAITSFDFNQNSSTIYKWLKNGLKDNLNCFFKLKNVSAALLYRNVLILGTDSGLVKIYYNPFNANGHLNMYKRKPDISIDLKRKCKLDACMPCKSLTQIDVLETGHGHKVIVSIDRSLIFILEFDEFERNCKRSVSNASTGGPRVKRTIK